jgi:hypothetical protein
MNAHLPLHPVLGRRNKRLFPVDFCKVNLDPMLGIKEGGMTVCPPKLDFHQPMHRQHAAMLDKVEALNLGGSKIYDDGDNDKYCERCLAVQRKMKAAQASGVTFAPVGSSAHDLNIMKGAFELMRGRPPFG